MAGPGRGTQRKGVMVIGADAARATEGQGVMAQGCRWRVGGCVGGGAGSGFCELGAVLDFWQLCVR